MLRVAREVLVLLEQLRGVAARAVVDAVAGVALAATVAGRGPLPPPLLPPDRDGDRLCRLLIKLMSSSSEK